MNEYDEGMKKLSSEEPGYVQLENEKSVVNEQ